MSFFLSPFKFVFELIGFLISAAFVYGLLLIASVTIIWYGMIELKLDFIFYVMFYPSQQMDANCQMEDQT